LVQRNENLTIEELDESFTHYVASFNWEIIRESIFARFGVEITNAERIETARAIVYNQFLQYGIPHHMIPEAEVDKMAKTLLDNSEQNERVNNAITIQKIVTLLKENASIESVIVDEQEIRDTFGKYYSQPGEENEEFEDDEVSEDPNAEIEDAVIID
jgi:hypothetical protein